MYVEVFLTKHMPITKSEADGVKDATTYYD